MSKKTTDLANTKKTEKDQPIALKDAELDEVKGARGTRAAPRRGTEEDPYVSDPVLITVDPD